MKSASEPTLLVDFELEDFREEEGMVIEEYWWCYSLNIMMSFEEGVGIGELKEELIPNFHMLDHNVQKELLHIL